MYNAFLRTVLLLLLIQGLEHHFFNTASTSNGRSNTCLHVFTEFQMHGWEFQNMVGVGRGVSSHER